MNIGRLDRLVRIRRWQDVADMGASLDQTFDPGVTAYANKRAASGALYFGTQQVETKVTDIFTIRYREGITGEHVVELDGIRYRVKRASPYRDQRVFTVIETEQLGVIK